MHALREPAGMSNAAYRLGVLLVVAGGFVTLTSSSFVSALGWGMLGIGLLFGIIGSFDDSDSGT